MPFPFALEGRAAIVTGGATTRLLASVGAGVFISSRKLDNLERVARSVEAETGRRIGAADLG